MLGVLSVASSAEPIVIGGIAKTTLPPYLWYDYCKQKHIGYLPLYIDSLFHLIEQPYQYAEPLERRNTTAKLITHKLVSHQWDTSILTQRFKGDHLRFSDLPVMTSEEIAVYRHTAFSKKPQSLSDFAQRTGSIPNHFRVKTGPDSFQNLEAKGLKLVTHRDADEATRRLLSGEVDFIFINEQIYNFQMKGHPHADDFHRLYSDSISVKFYFAAAINNRDFPFEKINQALSDMSQHEASRTQLLMGTAMRLWISQRQCAVAH